MLKIENIIDPEKRNDNEYLLMILKTIAPSLFDITNNIYVSYGDDEDNINKAYDVDIDNGELFITDGVVKMRQLLSINFIEINYASYIIIKRNDNIRLFLNLIEIEEIMNKIPLSLEIIDKEWTNIEDNSNDKK